MFGFFRKKQAGWHELPLLQLDDTEFIGSVRRSVVDSHKAALVMWLVAYQNLNALKSVTFQAAKSEKSKGLPQTDDEFISFLAHMAENQPEDLAKRRMQWFFLASLLDGARRRARQVDGLLDILAEIWAAMARSGALLPTVYRVNLLWSEDEKEWFRHLSDERSGVDYVLNFMTPSIIRKHPKIQSVAAEYDIYVSQSPGSLA